MFISALVPLHKNTATLHRVRKKVHPLTSNQYLSQTQWWTILYLFMDNLILITSVTKIWKPTNIRQRYHQKWNGALLWTWWWCHMAQHNGHPMWMGRKLCRNFSTFLSFVDQIKTAYMGGIAVCGNVFWLSIRVFSPPKIIRNSHFYSQI